MKKLLTPIIIVLVLFISYFLFAQQCIPHDVNAIEPPLTVGDNTGRLADYSLVHLASAQSELQNHIVTNTDGGIIVMAGSFLLKYDKDLNLLRKVQIDVSMNEKIKNIHENDIQLSESIRFLRY